LKAKKGLTKREDQVSRAQIIADFKRVKKKLGRVPKFSEMMHLGMYGKHNYFTELFGGYYNFLTTLNEKSYRRTSHIENLTKEFYRLKEKLGRLPTSREFSTLGKYHISSLMYQYGNWNNFVRSLGETPRKPGSQIPLLDIDLLRKSFADFVEKNKREPNSVEFEGFSKVSIFRMNYQFGGWLKLSSLLKKTSPSQKKPRTPTD
jgi:hypothetical protein